MGNGALLQLAAAGVPDQYLSGTSFFASKEERRRRIRIRNWRRIYVLIKRKLVVSRKIALVSCKLRLNEDMMKQIAAYM